MNASPSAPRCTVRAIRPHHQAAPVVGVGLFSFLVMCDEVMIDAPHAGAVVRVEPDRWGSYLGATRPALGAPRTIPMP